MGDRANDGFCGTNFMEEMTMRSLLAATALAIVGLTVGVAPASAKSFANMAGGVGDATAPEECEAGKYLVGVKLRSGAWWDQLTIACAAPRADATFGPLAFGTPRGGTGGGEATLYLCPDNEVVIGANVEFTEGNRQVAHAVLNCASEETLQYRQSIGAPAVSANGSNHGAFISQQCSPGEAATGFNVRFGQHVNALGMICDTFQRPAAVMAAKVPAVDPAQQAAAQKALGDQIKFERQVTGKSMGQCQQSNAMCEARLRNALGPNSAPIEIATQCVPFYQQCMSNAAADQAEQAAAQKALGDQIKFERQVTGKTAEQCVATNAACEARLRNALGPINAPMGIAQQCLPFYQQCMTNAAAAAATPGPAPAAPAPNADNPPAQGAGKTAKVVQATDVYDSAGGDGKTIGWLNVGATVTLVGTCDDNWCHVKGAAVPGGDGYVYSGPDYEALKY